MTLSYVPVLNCSYEVARKGTIYNLVFTHVTYLSQPLRKRPGFELAFDEMSKPHIVLTPHVSTETIDFKVNSQNLRTYGRWEYVLGKLNTCIDYFSEFVSLFPVLGIWIWIRSIRMFFLGLLNLDTLVRGTDPGPSLFS
jgi:hypothetical protein